MDNTIVECMNELLRPGINKKNSGTYFKMIQRQTIFPNSFLKEYVKTIKQDTSITLDAETAIKIMDTVYEYIIRCSEIFIRKEEDRAIPLITDELIELYSNVIPELSEKMQELKNDGKNVFEFPRHQKGGQISESEYYDFYRLA